MRNALNLRFRILVTFLLFIPLMYALPPEGITIKGRVTDETLKEGVPGANVTVDVYKRQFYTFACINKKTGKYIRLWNILLPNSYIALNVVPLILRSTTRNLKNVQIAALSIISILLPPQ